MKRLLWILLLGVLAAACGKEDFDTTEKAFRYNGAEFVTLQEALDFATLSSAADIAGDIMMIADYIGPGATASANYSGYLCLDLNGHNCRIHTPLNIGTSCTFLTGSGAFEGDIKASNAFLCISEGVRMEGDLTLTDTRAAEKELWEEDVFFDESFSGSFKGSITLENVMLALSSIKGTFDIKNLTVRGSKGIFSVGVPDKSVNVAKARVKDEGRICAVEARSINVASGAQPHIHNLVKTEEIAATCVSPKTIKYACTECDYVQYIKADDIFGACPPESLVHFEARPATATERGNVEYWECPLCGRKYKDAQGKVLLEGSVTIMATSFSADEALLNDLDDEFDWRSEFQPETKSVFATVGTIVSLIGMVQKATNIVSSLVSTGEDPHWVAVKDKMDQMQSSLGRIEAKIDAIAQLVDAASYRQTIIERNRQLNFLDTKSTPAFQLIVKYINSNDADRGEKIASVLQDWSDNKFGGATIADLTQSLIQQYVNTGLEVNIPGMMEKVANCAYLWEHEGYNFRYQSIAHDAILTSISYLMTATYVASIKEYRNEDLRQADLERLRSDLAAYEAAVKAELEKMDERYEKYRRYNPSNITFNVEAKSYDFRQWFVNHRNNGFPRLNQNGKAVENCELVLKDLGLNKDLGLTTAMAQEIYNHYNKDRGEKISIYTLLRDSVGFRNLPKQFDPGIIFTDKQTGFDHVGGDDAVPVYRMFHWESYRSCTNCDYFGIRTCLNDNCTESNHNILFNCDISSYSSGHINSLGEETRWIWYTLVKSPQQ